MLNQCRYRYNGQKLVLSCACIAIYLSLVCLSGGSLIEAVRLYLCAFGYVFIPGLFFVKILKLEKTYDGLKIPLAVLCGTGFFAVLYCVSMRLGILWMLHILPIVISILCLWQMRKEKRISLSKNGEYGCYILLWGVLVLLFAFSVSVKMARPSAAGEIVLSEDMLWNIGNANSFKIAFPPQDIRFSEVRLSYHYLTELVAGALSIVSGVSAYNIFSFYIGPVILAALIACLYNMGLCFYNGHKGKTLLFTFSMFIFNCASTVLALTNGRGVFWNTNLQHLITNVNSQSTGVIFMSIFFSMFVKLANRGFDCDFISLLAFICSALMMIFAKGPAGAIVTCAFVITMVFVLFRKPKYLKALFALVGVAGAFILVYFTMFSSGVNTSVRFGFVTMEFTIFADILKSAYNFAIPLYYALLPIAMLLQLCGMQPVQLPLYFSGLWQDIRHLPTLPPQRILANGIVAGGVLAYLLFWHPSYSQVYFVLVAILFINLLAVDRITYIKKNIFGKIIAALGIIGIVTSAVLCVNFIGSGTRQLARNLDIIPKYPYEVLAKSQDEEAMMWLKDNSDKSAKFATNRVGGGGISNIYSALSERQAFMEGYTYAITNMGVSEQVVKQKQNINAALFDANTQAEQVSKLCRENNIDFLVISEQAPYDTKQLTQCALVYENADVKIYKP